MKLQRKQWNNIWFTSDWHLGHDRPFIYEYRGFKHIKEHDDFLIDNYNTLVDKEDLVFNMGDFTFQKAGFVEDMIKNVLTQSTRYFIKGNHDRCTTKYTLPNGITDIRIVDQPITLSHFSMLSWNKSHYGAWNICGHSHGSLPESLPDHVVGKRCDVGVDVGIKYNDKFMFTYEDL